MSTYPPTFITIEHTLICVSKKSRFWWRHHDVTHFLQIGVGTYHLTNIIQKELWNYHVLFVRYRHTVKNMHNSYKIMWWRHHHMTLIFVYNTSRNTCIPSLNQVGPTVPEKQGPKVCTFSMTSRDLGWRHHDAQAQLASWDGHLSICQVWSRSEVKQWQKCHLERKRV